jgi:hypothetical protein
MVRLFWISRADRDENRLCGWRNVAQFGRVGRDVGGRRQIMRPLLKHDDLTVQRSKLGMSN